MNIIYIVITSYLLLSVLGTTLSFGMWAVGAFSNNYTQSVNGKKGVLISGSSIGLAIVGNILYAGISSPNTAINTVPLGFISIIVAFITVIFSTLIAVRIYIEQRKTKQISYQFLSDIRVKMNNNAEKLQILYDGSRLSNVRILYLKIWNSGNVAILPEDYSEPIGIEFGEEILDVEVRETEPKYMKVLTSIYDRNIKLEPLLLNSEDVIILRIYLTNLGTEEEVSFHARIIGTRIIAKKGLRRESKSFETMINFT